MRSDWRAHQSDPQAGLQSCTGALFLMGGIYPRTNAILKELGHYNDLVPWKAITHVMDCDRQRHIARFDKATSFIMMPVISLLDRLELAIGVMRQLLLPGPKLLFDGAELALYEDREIRKKVTN
ncbi:unnamed protein product [Clonostachys rhizophaga]|uniref:Uncharacterized protein n=1 Tax=Clonostachys rhizophaga TaxID=160324 RepID=A0A9N9VIT1_9HYPO|nr:unnamed protein product [Clonostachys rhizophaga]